MTKYPKICKAVQYGDTMLCTRCGQTWDTNDPDPPRCMPLGTPDDEYKNAFDKATNNLIVYCALIWLLVAVIAAILIKVF